MYHTDSVPLENSVFSSFLKREVLTPSLWSEKAIPPASVPLSLSYSTVFTCMTFAWRREDLVT